MYMCTYKIGFISSGIGHKLGRNSLDLNGLLGQKSDHKSWAERNIPAQNQNV